MFSHGKLFLLLLLACSQPLFSQVQRGNDSTIQKTDNAHETTAKEITTQNKDNQDSTTRQNIPQEDMSDMEVQSDVAESILGMLKWTIILAVTTIILALVGICQVWVANDIRKRDLRAYVYLDGGAHEPPEDSTALFYVRNCGKTPAYNVRTILTTEKAPYPLTTELRHEEIPTDLPKTVLHPGEYRVILAPKTVLDVNETTAFDKGTLGVYTFGETTYEDAFGVKRYSKFRFVTSKITGEDKISACEHGNEAT